MDDALRSADARTILRASGPRVMRDTFAPLLSFYGSYKLAGLLAGVVAGTVVAVAIIVYERRRGRSGSLARLALGLVFIRAAAGLLTGSARVYLAQDVLIDVLLGSAFLVSVRIGRPLTAVFAREMFPLPERILRSATYASVFARVTLIWAAYFFACATVRGIAILTLSVDAYAVVSAVTGGPFIIALLIFSVRHTIKRFRASAEWGPFMAQA